MSTAIPRAEAAPARVDAGVPSLGVDTGPADLWPLFRYLTAMLFIAVALAACVWTRMAVRATALELDASRGALARAEIDHERLEVERALLRDPGRLQTQADALGLVSPTAIVTIPAEGTTP